MEVQAAAHSPGNLDQQVRRIGGQRVAGQRALRDVDGAVHHLEAAQLGDHGLALLLGGLVIVGSYEPAQHRATRLGIE